jgi:hypothetical protein
MVVPRNSVALEIISMSGPFSKLNICSVGDIDENWTG